ncbi:MAG: hypothetical protein K6U03_02925 [Firmicutes bacterium]|nr:hypothetical protein [Bacillota bacterium]
MPEKSPSLYPYPAVQYIPLLTTTIVEGPWTPPPGLDQPALQVGRNDPAWREFLRRTHGLTLPPLTLASGEILLLGLNLRFLDLKYRGHFVTTLAEEAPDYYQLLRLNQNIFYKDRIIFAVFAQDGRKLCWQSWERDAVKTARKRA